MTHAVHSCGILDDGKIIYGGEAAGYVLRFDDGRSLYFAGDTNVFSDMALIQELYRPELAMLPIGDLFTMSPREAAVACRLLKAKRVIPMHFGTFPPLVGRPDHLSDLIRELPDTTVWPLEPGKWRLVRDSLGETFAEVRAREERRRARAGLPLGLSGVGPAGDEVLAKGEGNG
jgi:L-ascorbate metabolism protein UlaG (beta-lactamase superfamily)